MRQTPRSVAPFLLALVASLAASQGNSRGADFPYDRVRRDIESAGRQGNLKSLERSIAEIDRETAKVTPLEETACWQLLKGTALVELGHPGDAKAIFSVLADTCPIWEAFNNLAVLEAADGEFGPARENLLRALDRVGKTEPAEAGLPQGNLRKVLEEQDGQLLILAGFAKECTGKPTPLADCLVSEPPRPPQ